MVAASSRVFFALWPDDAVREALAALAHEVARETRGRSPPESNAHLTLAFLGEQPSHRIEALRGLASSVRARSFGLTLDEIGCFRKNGVAWLGASAPQPNLLALQTNLALALRDEGFPVDERPYTPHLTLARRIRASIQRNLPRPILWEVTSFALVASELGRAASTYRTLAEWPLASS
jgi:2'-5' RNA ligase